MKNEHKNQSNERPFGPDGPRVTLMPKEFVPAPGSELTSFGMRILRELPYSKKGKGRVGMGTLIVDTLRGGGDYAGYVGMIKSLAEGGYLDLNEKTSGLTISDKGIQELQKANRQNRRRH